MDMCSVKGLACSDELSTSSVVRLSLMELLSLFWIVALDFYPTTSFSSTLLSHRRDLFLAKKV